MAEISLIVGDSDKASTININTVGTLVASAGHRGTSFGGGDGYSGGGGYGSCNGGSDGGDGECSDGGFGTGEDITSYTFQNYRLSPGAGGEYSHNNIDCYGGGGGGVLVD